jgi:hypothetical protein
MAYVLPLSYPTFIAIHKLSCSLGKFCSCLLMSFFLHLENGSSSGFRTPLSPFTHKLKAAECKSLSLPINCLRFDLQTSGELQSMKLFSSFNQIFGLTRIYQDRKELTLRTQLATAEQRVSDEFITGNYTQDNLNGLVLREMDGYVPSAQNEIGYNPLVSFRLTRDQNSVNHMNYYLMYHQAGSTHVRFAKKRFVPLQQNKKIIYAFPTQDGDILQVLELNAFNGTVELVTHSYTNGVYPDQTTKISFKAVDFLGFLNSLL